jgi:hypothetical protein
MMTARECKDMRESFTIGAVERLLDSYEAMARLVKELNIEAHAAAALMGIPAERSKQNPVLATACDLLRQYEGDGRDGRDAVVPSVARCVVGSYDPDGEPRCGVCGVCWRKDLFEPPVCKGAPQPVKPQRCVRCGADYKATGACSNPVCQGGVGESSWPEYAQPQAEQPKPRRMHKGVCSLPLPCKSHYGEHDELTERKKDGSEPHYTCAYHKCQPVPEPQLNSKAESLISDSVVKESLTTDPRAWICVKDHHRHVRVLPLPSREELGRIAREAYDKAECSCAESLDEWDEICGNAIYRALGVSDGK